MKYESEANQLWLIVKEIQEHTILKKNGKNILDHTYNFVIAGHRVYPSFAFVQDSSD